MQVLKQENNNNMVKIGKESDKYFATFIHEKSADARTSITQYFAKKEHAEYWAKWMLISELELNNNYYWADYSGEKYSQLLDGLTELCLKIWGDERFPLELRQELELYFKINVCDQLARYNIDRRLKEQPEPKTTTETKRCTKARAEK